MDSLCELLPWFAAETLEPEERRQVILHLAHCADCRQELPWLLALRDQVRSEMSQLEPHALPDRAEILQMARVVLDQLPVRIPQIELRKSLISIDNPFGLGPLLSATLVIPNFRSVNIGEWLMAASQY